MTPRDLIRDADPRYTVTLTKLQDAGACGVGAKAAFRAVGLPYDAEVPLRDLADLIPERITGQRLRRYIGWAVATAAPSAAGLVAEGAAELFAFRYEWYGPGHLGDLPARGLRWLADALRYGTAR